MKWRLKVLAFIISILAVQLVFLALCYSSLATFTSTFTSKYGAPNNDGGVAAEGGGGSVVVNGYRSAREIAGAPAKKATSLKWLQAVATGSTVTAAASHNLSEEEASIVKKELGNVLTSATGSYGDALSSSLKEEAYVQTTVGSIPEVVTKHKLSKERRMKRLNPYTMLPHAETEEDFRSAAEKERYRTLQRLREKRMKGKEQQQEEYRRKAAERRARKTNKQPESKETAEEKRKRTLKSIPQMEKERSDKLHELWEEEKRKPGKASLDYDKFAAQYEGDPLSYNLSEYFTEVCESKVEPLVECSNRSKRVLNESETEGVDILFSMRTTMKFHDNRLPLVFETWLSEVDPANVYIVTDGDDEDLAWKLRTLRMNYVNTQTGSSHNISDLCCKAGVEMELMFAQENLKFNWLCHVDDDMYVSVKPLTQLLSSFDPVKEPVYLGRSGSPWAQAREVKNVSGLGTPGKRYHFAVGGMYCLSRAMMDMVKEHLGGCEAFRKSCLLAQEPEDVTVGLVVGAVLGLRLQRTEMIYSHGLDLLSAVPSSNIKDQIAFSYGLGAEQIRGMIPNVVYVPGGLFNLDEDNTQFRSIHCYLHSDIDWCLEKKKQVVEEKKRRRDSNSKDCSCSWKNFICCQVYKDNHRRYMMEKKKEERQRRLEERRRMKHGH